MLRRAPFSDHRLCCLRNFGAMLGAVVKLLLLAVIVNPNFFGDFVAEAWACRAQRDPEA